MSSQFHSFWGSEKVALEAKKSRLSDGTVCFPCSTVHIGYVKGHVSFILADIVLPQYEYYMFSQWKMKEMSLTYEFYLISKYF